MDAAVLAYILLIVAYRLTENFVMAKVGSLGRKPAADWTMNLVYVPFGLIMLLPPFEYMYLNTPLPGPLNWGGGGALLLLATAVRVKAHLDLRLGFSMAIEKLPGQSLVTTGIYSIIRHPLYLGNLLLFFACPILLAARWTWIVVGLGVVGVLLRIRIEERFLRETMSGYDEYARRTRALIPGLY